MEQLCQAATLETRQRLPSYEVARLRSHGVRSSKPNAVGQLSATSVSSSATLDTIGARFPTGEERVPVAQRGDVSIHYEFDGIGPAAILHTGGGGDLAMWRQAGYTSRLGRRRVVLMDHRGHGLSSRPTGIENHGIDEYVDDVIGVADDLGLDTFSFVGYSAGADVGTRLAQRFPARVAALVAIGAPWGPDDPPDDRREFAREVRRDGIGLLVDALRGEEPEVPAWFIQQMRATDPEMFALELEGLASWGGPWGERSEIRVPMLIIAGEAEDDGSAPINAEMMSASFASCRHVIIPGLGHCMTFVRSDLVLPHLVSFLGGVADA